MDSFLGLGRLLLEAETGEKFPTAVPDELGLKTELSEVWQRAITDIGSDLDLFVGIISLGMGAIKKLHLEYGERGAVIASRNKASAIEILRQKSKIDFSNLDAEDTKWWEEATKFAEELLKPKAKPQLRADIDESAEKLQVVLKTRIATADYRIETIRGLLKTSDEGLDSSDQQRLQTVVERQEFLRDALKSELLEIIELTEPKTDSVGRAIFWGKCDFHLVKAGWTDKEIAELVRESVIVMPQIIGQTIVDEFFRTTLNEDSFRDPVDRVREVRKRIKKIAKSAGHYWGERPVTPQKNVP